MPFSAQELANAANAALEFYFDKGRVKSQSLQNKPLLKALDERAKTFPGGKENISLAVKGEYSGDLTGYTHDDEVAYYNPANIKRAKYPWREHHIGLEITLTELKTDGISVVDSLNSDRVSEHSEREMTVLVGLLDDKIEDMGESYDRGLNGLLWGDGTADAKAIAGIRSLILDDPDSGSTGGLSRSAHSWWRNLAYTNSNNNTDITGSTSDGGAIPAAMQKAYRQARRYGGNPTLWLAGSDFLDQLEKELRANGVYSQEGFNSRARTEVGVADISFKGNRIQYDPTLDDLSLAKWCYAIDLDAIFLDYMEGEKMKRHSPARPAERYVMFRAMTTTGALVARQLNSSIVFELD
jgi:hypothetical protein